MTHCRRCHRSIVNPKSVQHGFGPVCWSKLNAQGYDERPMMFRITITDQKEATKSLARVREVMGAALKNGTRTVCMNCGEPLRPENIEYYDHPGGYDLPGFGQPQWLYHHCEGIKNGKKCNHDLSLWKLRIPELPSTEKAVDNDVSCLEHLDSTDAGGEPGDVGYKSLAEREDRVTAHGRTMAVKRLRRECEHGRSPDLCMYCHPELGKGRIGEKKHISRRIAEKERDHDLTGQDEENFNED